MVLATLAGLAHAQQFGPVEVIPITKVREHYNNPAEDGTGKSCGVRLFGEFPVYKNYTNHNSYTLFTPELQRNPHGEFGSVAPPAGRKAEILLLLQRHLDTAERRALPLDHR